MDTALLTIADVAQRWGCAPKTVSRRIKSGELPVVRLGRNTLRIDPDALAEYERKLTAVERLTRMVLSAEREDNLALADSILDAMNATKPTEPE